MTENELRPFIANNGKLPSLHNKYSGNLIVTGSAKCLYEDLKAAKFILPNNDIMSVNESGIWLNEKIVHWFSFHGEKLQGWKDKRDEVFSKQNIILHTVDGHNINNITSWPFSVGGSSALGAVIVGLALGYSKIVLCGCPLDNSGYIQNNSKEHSNFLNEVKGPGENKWLSLRDSLFNNRVKSMSGRTKEWLGSVFSR